MESIITFIVILLIGSLFGGKKNKKQNEQKQAKPFTAQPSEHPSPFKKLKEMSQEMYREIQQEMQQQETEPERKQQPTVVRQAEVMTPPPAPNAVTRSVARPKQSTRKTRDQSTSNHRRTRQQARRERETVVTVNKTESLLPKTEEDIMKGIIFSEIFGPPKSKR